MQVGNKIGVLITPTNNMGIFVNSACVHAMAVPVQDDQKVYPLIRIMGNAKSVKLIPGSQPPRSAGTQVVQIMGSSSS